MDNNDTRPLHPVLVGLAAFCAVAYLAAGLYAARTHDGAALDGLSFGLSFLEGALALLGGVPTLAGRLRRSGRAVLGSLIVLALAVSLPTLWVIVQQPVIRIAISLPLSGPDRSEGVSMLNAFTLAIREFGPVGGYAIELVPFDDRFVRDRITYLAATDYETPRSGTLADIAADDRVAAVLGPFTSDAALAEIPVLGRAGLALVSPSATLSCLTAAQCLGRDMNTHGTFLRATAPDPVRAAQLASRLAVEYRKGLRTRGEPIRPARVALTNDGSPFGKALAAEFGRAWTNLRDRGVGGAAPTPYQPGDVAGPFEGPRPPDILLYAGTGGNGIPLVKSLKRRAASLDGLIVAGSGTLMNPSFTDELAVGPRVGSFYAMTSVPTPNTKGLDKFETEYGNAYERRTLTAYCATAYDTARAVMASVHAAAEVVRPPSSSWDPFSARQARTFRAKVLDNLRMINQPNHAGFDSLAGSFQFNEHGEADYGLPSERQVTLYRYEWGNGDATREWVREEPSAGSAAGD